MGDINIELKEKMSDFDFNRTFPDYYRNNVKN